jgi:hypothetical protein
VTSSVSDARIATELADQTYGDRNYTAEDPEGQLRTFARYVRDVSPEDVHPYGPTPGRDGFGRTADRAHTCGWGPYIWRAVKGWR